MKPILVRIWHLFALKVTLIISVKLILIACLSLSSLKMYAGEVVIIDAQHYSHVLGEMRKYRILLPPDYDENPDKKYPVVYFYHGWSQRYFGSLVRNEKDQSKRTIDDDLVALVAQHSLIVVKPDGYNAEPDAPYYLRPYNIGPVETHRQFPLYFPELVDEIDANYRTLPDRNHRAISGFSMGGFMSFWIAGKYPHLLAAAGSFCGSAEFVVGPKDFPVEYHHLYMYKNYKGLKLRLNYGKDDFIRAYHRDIDRVWKPLIDNYESQVYDAAHSVCGIEDMFRFYAEVFNEPPAQPQQWHHIDVYPEFSVWDYQVRSDRNVPGFTVLENVDKNGFRVSVRKFLPEGETLPMVNLSVFTAPLYEGNTEYIINIVNLSTGHKVHDTLRSDAKGRLKIALNGGLQEVGISEPQGLPNISIASVKIDSETWAAPEKDISVFVGLLNKGGSHVEGATASLLPFRDHVSIKKDVSDFGNIDVNEIKTSTSPFVFRVISDSVQVVKFKLNVTDQAGHQWQQSLVVDIKSENTTIENYEIADGRKLTFIRGGKDTVRAMIGKGNGDGIANPGESIAILVEDGGQLWPASLYSLNQSVNLQGTSTRISDSWTGFDHVGGTFKFDVPILSSHSAGKSIDLLAEYWLPEYPDHHIKKGKISVQVVGKDRTPPQISWINIADDNILQVKFYDGDEVSQAKATLHFENDPNAAFQVDLNDQGMEGDSVAGDQVFGQKIKVPKFGLYQLSIIVSDFSGNENIIKIPESNVLYGAKLYHK